VKSTAGRSFDENVSGFVAFSVSPAEWKSYGKQGIVFVSMSLIL